MADLARLRDDFGYFASVVRGAPLADWQAHDLSAQEEMLLLLWARQLGKSLGLSLRALWRAFGAARRTVLIISGSGELGAKRLMSDCRRYAADSPILAGSVADEQAGLLRLSNGSEIRSVAASEGSVRGWRVDELLVDEAQLVPDDLLLGAALPTVSAREGARVVLAGTASVASGAFYDLCRRAEVGEEGLRLSRRVSRLVGGEDLAPWQNPTMIEAQLRAMGPLRADAEHRGLWSSGMDSFVTRAVLDRVVADYRAEPLEWLRPPARVVAGLDWGWRRDRSSLVAIGRLPLPDGHRFAVRTAKRWPQAHPLPSVVADVVESPGHFHVLVPELNGIGGPRASASKRGCASDRTTLAALLLGRDSASSTTASRRTTRPT